ncbi:protein with DnaJ-like domain [Spongiibacter sp. IMCC21906]|jgi:DnaJ like chaperone protein|uniref:co-chaperone DjlA n=1 Tax=Spongiibacter sp. IMCC21906 TaxID=1620392 RepID=UPI00062DF3D1|nr:co-chaperone DjlA [Spongiibacter sp. IMCC21906]AKH68130.1 protein with DnaJ-like domain [Spongiibacter sp. IMCC21906]
MGKIIGAVLGFMMGGPLMALLGLAVGHFFDRGLGKAMRFNYGAEREHIEKVFFDTVFRVMGHLAKADGRVSESEIAQAEAIMTQLGLSGQRRQDAISRFKEGSGSDFLLEPQIAEFVRVVGRQNLLRRLLLEALLAMALADGHFDAAEKDVLQKVAQYLGVSAADFERLLQMASAQQRFHQGGGQQQGWGSSPRPNELDEAYQALGVSKSATDAELKRAYRKLMSEHHPDKLIAKGVPDEMVKLATEKSQEIQGAYELIKKSRGK